MTQPPTEAGKKMTSAWEWLLILLGLMSKDTQPPTLTISVTPNPLTESDVRATILANVSDDKIVRTVTVRRGTGELVGIIDKAPWQITDQTVYTHHDNGPKTYTAIASDGVNNSAEASATLTIAIPEPLPDPVLNPVVSLSAVLRDKTVILSATASSARGIKYVKFYRVKDGVETLIKQENGAPYEAFQNVTIADNGSAVFRARAFDRSLIPVTGEDTQIVAINIADVTPPVISSFGMPDHSSGTVTVAGPIKFRANASDNVAIKQVDFYRNNVLIAEDVSEPYEVEVLFSAADNGNVQIKAIVQDTASPANTAEQIVNLTVAIPVSTVGTKYIEPEYSTITWLPPLVIDDALITAKGITPIVSGPDVGRYLIDLEDKSYRTLTKGECAIYINTKKPIIVQNGRASGPKGNTTGESSIGNAVYGRPPGNSMAIDVKLRHMSITTPGMDLLDGTRAGGMLFAYAANVIVENCNFEGCGFNIGESGFNGGTVRVERNYFKNINGRFRDRSSPNGWKQGTKSPTTYDMVQAVQFDKVRGVVGMLVANNWVDNAQGLTQTEDIFNTYKSGGTAASPLKIIGNLVNGSYDMDLYAGHSGSGVVIGDEGGDHTEVIGNLFARTTNTGASMSSMNYGKIIGNIIVQTGFSMDGSIRLETNGTIDVGIYARNYVSGFVMDKATNIVDDNDVYWGAPLNGQPTRRLDWGFSSNATVGPIGNRSIPGPMTEAKIDQYINAHLLKWQNDGILVGRRNL